MDTALPEPEAARTPGRDPLTPTAAVLLALALGLCGGYLDLVMMVLKKYCWSDLPYFGSGKDFPWSIPAGHAGLLLIPGVLIACLCRLRPGGISLRAGAWLLAMLAIWSALLRAPIHGASALLLAAGLGRPIGGAVAFYLGRKPRSARLALALLGGLLIVLAGLSSGRQAVRQQRATAGLPAPPAGARNVILIVWDTVRASSLSLHDYPRDTTPNLVRWGRKGIQFSLALAPVPWTFPSHSCFFTGRWPYELDSHTKSTLDSPYATLAEYLASRGYETVGFAANTNYCSYETGLDRGFTHYEDYPLSPRSFLGRTVPGSWILKNILGGSDAYHQKWDRLQSRDARGINSAFLDWLRLRRQDRPFFAFLNYFDAHDPYVPPAGYVGRFGIRPKSARDYQLLIDFAHMNTTIAARDVVMARDCYDDCIAFLDDQLGRLLEELREQGLLDHTLVIITSDHGESFGIHGGIFGHGGSLYLDEIAVPLVIMAPGECAGRVVADPVSLRDLPATVVDQLGLSAGSPFSGRSLACLWRSSSEPSRAEITPAFSEIAHPAAVQPQPGNGLSRRGLQMSLVAQGRHYVRDGLGSERLYDLRRDPFEMVDLMGRAEGKQVVGLYRRMLLNVLTQTPGSIQTEDAYLKPFRQRLKSLVEESTALPEAVSALR
jgi:arylsulfatase A-like enzyme